MPVLDTGFLVALDQGDARAAACLADMVAAGSRLVVPAVAAAEYLTWHEDVEAALELLESSFEVSHTSPAWVVAAARERQRLRREGKGMRKADFWIGVWAAAEGTHVVTPNVADFAALGFPAQAW